MNENLQIDVAAYINLEPDLDVDIHRIKGDCHVVSIGTTQAISVYMNLAQMRELKEALTTHLATFYKIPEQQKRVITEHCPKCKTDVEIIGDCHILQRCPNCGEHIIACRICNNVWELTCEACRRKLQQAALVEERLLKDYKEGGV